MPFANGNCHVHISQVAGIVESVEPVLEVGLPKIGPKECVSHRPKQPAVSSWPGLDLPDEEGG